MLAATGDVRVGDVENRVNAILRRRLDPMNQGAGDKYFLYIPEIKRSAASDEV